MDRPGDNSLLDLARLAELPFTVSWFFLANGKLRERSMNGGWDVAVPDPTSSRPPTCGSDRGDRRRAAIAERLRLAGQGSAYFANRVTPG